MKNIIALVTFGCGLSSIAQAAGTSGAQFLKMGAGARAAAMGNAYSAVADDVTAGYWNPAGLSQIDSSQISVMHNEGLVDTKYEYLGAATKMGQSALALNVYSMNYGSIDSYDNSNNPTGSFDAGSLAGALTFASPLNDKLSWGVSAKYIKESIDDENATGFGGDFGLLYNSGNYKLAATLQNIGQKMKFVSEEASLPTLVRVGAARNFLSEKLLVAVDASKYNDNDLTYHGGLDFKVTQMMSLRAGYETTPSNNIDVEGLTGVAAGIGLQFSSLAFDYSFRPFGDLGDTHRVSLLIKFNRFNN